MEKTKDTEKRKKSCEEIENELAGEINKQNDENVHKNIKVKEEEKTKLEKDLRTSNNKQTTLNSEINRETSKAQKCDKIKESGGVKNFFAGMLMGPGMYVTAALDTIAIPARALSD